MTLSVLHTASKPATRGAKTAAARTRIDTTATSTAALLADRTAVEKAATSTDTVAVDTLKLISPVTRPCRVIAQMTNYESHVKDAGMDPASIPLTFFRKASASINGPFDDIVKPQHVRLLDYEVEVGLVIGRAIPVGTTISEANLGDFVAGLVVTNDVSARDIQLPQTQFYEAKSYPTFTPVGPELVLLTADELKRFGDLRLRLSVNGQERQNALVEGDMLYRPLQALQSLTQFQELAPGDLVLTGTPAGTALSAPPKPVQLVGNLLPPALKWKMFFSRQAGNRNYLHDGDVVEASVATDDGAIDLGTQRTAVDSRDLTTRGSPSSSWAPDRPASPPPRCWRSTAWTAWCSTAGPAYTPSHAPCTWTTRSTASSPASGSPTSSPRCRGRHWVCGWWTTGFGRWPSSPRPQRSVHGFPQANMFDQPELEALLRANLERHPTPNSAGTPKSPTSRRTRHTSASPSPTAPTAASIRSTPATCWAATAPTAWCAPDRLGDAGLELSAALAGRRRRQRCGPGPVGRGPPGVRPGSAREPTCASGRPATGGSSNCCPAKPRTTSTPWIECAR